MFFFPADNVTYTTTNQPTSSLKKFGKLFLSTQLFQGFDARSTAPQFPREAFWDRLMACKSTGSPAIQPAAHLEGGRIHPSESLRLGERPRIFWGGRRMVGAFLAEKRRHEWILKIFFKKKRGSNSLKKQNNPVPSHHFVI